ncbi:tryptophan synthase beta subunit-like PLP-dependent enzyme [Fimicolochytrium jonesii]|uniref:tryptophan synthase beta subunit-like PLP-dependent enzyme n=1 Tax=Fimicolochytrium jonesii TaxID=1396493 RepID=UPI0022FE24CD|nr:tryptophan synthase beta subunit-like PLP-dependent enzyme [Fimicolochytrium jonesii]KAI8824488.1 tryptophan synthase beta subunit-like PLP-dependent enzyme [Fimicolochytrium jonesii]
MRYRSTRGKSSGLTFEEAVFEGLAVDGGLYIPHSIPQIPVEEILGWSPLTFSEIAVKIFRNFIGDDEIPDADLTDIVARSFATFSTPEVTPLKKLPTLGADNLYILELFHGPTFAFKDIALQFLGNLFEYFLERRNKQGKSGSRAAITVLGATSGDTGGAAIYGLRGKKNVDVFILHPKGRISPVQEQQMTSVLDENVHNIALEGTFDDCQDTVKAAFSDEPFRRRFQLAAVNSINWARILAQTSYYFYSYLTLLKQVGAGSASAGSLPTIQYSVPTGNFGDVLAGYYAVRMGLPIAQLIVATNENDILHRFFQSGKYEKRHTANGHEEVKQTLSPAMDILVSSNFERLIWYLAKGDGRSGQASANEEEEEKKAQKSSETVTRWVTDLKEKGGFEVPSDLLARARELFTSFCTSDELTSDAIHRYYHHQYAKGATTDPGTSPYVLDPHTAVGVVAAEHFAASATYTACLSTASPGKFPEAILAAINERPLPETSKQNGFKPVTYADIAPAGLVALQGLPTRCLDIPTEGGNKAVALKRVRQAIDNICGGKFPA